LGEQPAPIGKIVPFPPLLISLNTIIIKNNPHGEEFMMIIPQAHSFGDAVAQGGASLARATAKPKSQVCNSRRRKKHLQSTKTQCNNDESSALIGESDLTQWVRTPPTIIECPSLS
jgi:hypothetical protein